MALWAYTVHTSVPVAFVFPWWVHGDVDHIILTKHEAERRAAADADSDEMKQAIADGFSIFSWSASHTSVFENEKYVQLKPEFIKFCQKVLKNDKRIDTSPASLTRLWIEVYELRKDKSKKKIAQNEPY